MAGGKLWTEDEDAEFLRMLKDGVRYTEIARLMGRSHSSVTNRAATTLARHKLPRIHAPGGRLWTRAEDESLRRMLREDAKYATIAKRLGRTRWAITQRAFIVSGRDRLPRLHKPGELTAWVKKLCIPDVADETVAGILGVSRTAVSVTRRRHGLISGIPDRKRPSKNPAKWTGISNKAKFLRLYSGVGRSDAEIARIIGITKQSVREIRDGFGLPPLGARAGAGLNRDSL